MVAARPARTPRICDLSSPRGRPPGRPPRLGRTRPARGRLLVQTARASGRAMTQAFWNAPGTPRRPRRRSTTMDGRGRSRSPHEQRLRLRLRCEPMRGPLLVAAATPRAGTSRRGTSTREASLALVGLTGRPASPRSSEGVGDDGWLGRTAGSRCIRSRDRAARWSVPLAAERRTAGRSHGVRGRSDTRARDTRRRRPARLVAHAARRRSC